MLGPAPPTPGEACGGGVTEVSPSTGGADHLGASLEAQRAAAMQEKAALEERLANNGSDNGMLSAAEEAEMAELEERLDAVGSRVCVSVVDVCVSAIRPRVSVCRG